MYCVVVAPATIVTGTIRGSPLPRSSTLCCPGDRFSVSGVTPRDSLSTNTCTPAGFVVTVRMPEDDAPAGAVAAEKNCFATYHPPTPSTRTTAAITAMPLHLRGFESR